MLTAVGFYFQGISTATRTDQIGRQIDQLRVRLGQFQPEQAGLAAAGQHVGCRAPSRRPPDADAPLAVRLQRRGAQRAPIDH